MGPRAGMTNYWGPNPDWAPSGPDWLWFATAGLFGLVVLWMLWLAWWRGRARGRLRCPKCWYDMSGLLSATSPPLWESGQGFTCPECGKHITMHRHLRKTRIRWRLVGVCAVLALLAAASGLLP